VARISGSRPKRRMESCAAFIGTSEESRRASEQPVVYEA
jgi:hypothetical protein